MYVTRPLSMYKRNPAALSDPPPVGPNSGYLVILDEEAQTYTCFGMCKDSTIKHLPLPQNKNLAITYSTGESTYYDKVTFIPVLNKPLSANCYYVIRRQGKHQGEASTSSKEEDGTTCLCCTIFKDVKPSPLDPFSTYQQVEIIKERYGFHAKSVATDGIPPDFLRRKGWNLSASTPRDYHLDEALGLNSNLRSRLPDFNFPLSSDHSESIIVGKWYCPFMFVKEGNTLKDQMKTSVFYKMTLVQRWDKIFSKERRTSEENNAVLVDVVVQTEVAKVGGRDAVWDEKKASDGVLWFEIFGGVEQRVGLSLAIVERMKWEQERVGWSGGNERQVRVEKVEEFGGYNQWNKFGCYVLVESYALKRMDGSLVLSYDFIHTHQIRCKWE